jgi:hypothetical protein
MDNCFFSLGVGRPREELESFTGLTSSDGVLSRGSTLSPRAFDSASLDESGDDIALGGVLAERSSFPEGLFKGDGGGAPSSASCDVGDVDGENQPRTRFIE